MSQLFTLLRAATYATTFVLVWGWAALSVRRFDRLLGGELPGWSRAPGALLMAAGGGLALLCIVLFVATGRGTPAPFDPPRRFVASGPYRWVRNPMYVGGVALMAGFGLWHRSPAILLLALFVWLLLHAFVRGFEEPDLARRFGAGYGDYRSAVRRWLPRPPGSAR